MSFLLQLISLKIFVAFILIISLTPARYIEESTLNPQYLLTGEGNVKGMQVCRWE
jgi:hypothetical protein